MSLLIGCGDYGRGNRYGRPVMKSAARRILHVLTNLHLSGAQLSVAMICSELQRRGWDVHVAFSSRGGLSFKDSADPHLCRMLQTAGATLHDIPAMVHRSSIVDDLRAACALYKCIQELDPAIIHTHMAKAGILGRFAAVAARRPAVHSVRGWAFDSAKSPIEVMAYVFLERAAALRTAQLLAVGCGARDVGLARGIGRREQYQIVRSGFDIPAERTPPRRDQAALLVGGIMELREKKAPAIFVRAAELIAAENSDVQFAIAGVGPLELALRQEAAARGLGERMHFMGRYTDLQTFIGSMDVHVLTSRFEGLPRVVVETMAAGIPNVTTDLPGTRELIEDGASGFIVPIDDPHAIADRVLTLLARPDLRVTMGDRARARITDEFLLSYVIDQHEAIYRTVLSKPQQRAS